MAMSQQRPGAWLATLVLVVFRASVVRGQFTERTYTECPVGTRITDGATCNRAAAVLGWAATRANVENSINGYPMGCFFNKGNSQLYYNKGQYQSRVASCSASQPCACMCFAGTFSNASSGCTSCPAGTYSLAGAARCFPASACPSNYYCPPRGRSPQRCPAGTSSVGGATSNSECYAALQGYEIVTSGTCPQNTVINTHLNCERAAQAVGWPDTASKRMGFMMDKTSFPQGCFLYGDSWHVPAFQLTLNDYRGALGHCSSSRQCVCRCVAGTHSNGSASRCTPCPSGTYSGQASAVCLLGSQCPVGYYCPPQTGVFKPCPSGKLSRIGASASDECFSPMSLPPSQGYRLVTSTAYTCSMIKDATTCAEAAATFGLLGNASGAQAVPTIYRSHAPQGCFIDLQSSTPVVVNQYPRASYQAYCSLAKPCLCRVVSDPTNAPQNYNHDQTSNHGETDNNHTGVAVLGSLLVVGILGVALALALRRYLNQRASTSPPNAFEPVEGEEAPPEDGIDIHVCTAQSPQPKVHSQMDEPHLATSATTPIL